MVNKKQRDERDFYRSVQMLPYATYIRALLDTCDELESKVAEAVDDNQMNKLRCMMQADRAEKAEAKVKELEEQSAEFVMGIPHMRAKRTEKAEAQVAELEGVAKKLAEDAERWANRVNVAESQVTTQDDTIKVLTEFIQDVGIDCNQCLEGDPGPHSTSCQKRDSILATAKEGKDANQ